MLNSLVEDRGIELACNRLGDLFADQGKLAEAEQIYQWVLQGKEIAWGPDHTTTLDTVNNLGNLYKAQGRFVKAEQMYQRALQCYDPHRYDPNYETSITTKSEPHG